MTLVEPPPRGEPLPEEPPVEAAIVPIVPAGSTITKDVCDVCRRPVVKINEVWHHWAPSIDRPDCPDYHPAVLYVEPPIPWGFLGMHGDPLVTTIPRGGSGLRNAA